MCTPTKLFLRVLSILILVSTSAQAAVSLTLDYQSYAGTQAFAAVGIPSPGDPYVLEPFDSQYTEQSDVGAGLVSVSTYAHAEVFAFNEEVPGDPPGEPPTYEPRFHEQNGEAHASVQAQIINGTDLQFTSSISSSESSNFWDGEPVGWSRCGAWTHLAGTLEIGTETGTPEGTPVILPISAVIDGDPTRPLWSWSVEFYRDEDVIATLAEGLSSAPLSVNAGETISYKLTHLPEPTTVMILLPSALLLLRRSRRQRA